MPGRYSSVQMRMRKGRSIIRVFGLVLALWGLWLLFPNTVAVQSPDKTIIASLRSPSKTAGLLCALVPFGGIPLKNKLMVRQNKWFGTRLLVYEQPTTAFTGNGPFPLEIRWDKDNQRLTYVCYKASLTYQKIFIIDHSPFRAAELE